MSFLNVCWPFPPWSGGVIGIVITRTCTGCWTGPPLCSVVVTALLWAGSAPSCWSRIPQICFWAVVWGGQDWSISAERATEYSSAGAVHLEICGVACHLLCMLTKYTCWHCPWPASTVGQAIGLSVPKVLCWQSPSADPLAHWLKSGTRTAIVTHLDPSWELQNQLIHWLCLTVPHLAKPTAASTRPAPVRAVLCSDVLQALRFQSC